MYIVKNRLFLHKLKMLTHLLEYCVKQIIINPFIIAEKLMSADMPTKCFSNTPPTYLFPVNM